MTQGLETPNPAMTMESLLQFLAFLLAAGAAALLAKQERRHISALVSFYVGSLVLRGIGILLSSLVMPASSRVFVFLAFLFQGLAILNLVAVYVFEFFLRLLRVEAPRILRDLAKGVLAVGLLLYLFSRYHVDVTGIVATSAVLTAVIGFSLQDTLINLMGGIALQLDRSVEVGDWLQFGDQTGKVVDITWRYTAIEKRNGNLVIFPNSVLVKNPFQLRGKRPDGTVRERRWIYFNVDCRTSSTAVIDAVQDALTREPIPYAAPAPPPKVLITDFKDSWVQYGIQYWLADLAQDDPVDSVVRARVYYGLKRCGIPLSIPAATIFTEASDATERRQRHSEREQAARVRALESVPLFASLTSEERLFLAEALIHAPFAPGEAMVVQGRAVHHLYIMTRGEADVRISVEGAPPRIVSRITAPDFFGEMGMLTGEPRRASVIAVSEVECWRLEKERFQELMLRRPQLASEISHVLAEREVNLAAVKEGLSAEARRSRLQSAHSSLTEKVRLFFGLQ